eukprot:CAMPEP_0202835174 /NCGR_PEP_ID=MMETSP1389-20130828/35565_1 /ASSEMBLY_ACC=CAM_ASM_000865 /TAXON_ID=302021 /ORGANISM="Rhodomonas sp., Strain CCMP768" /LENGTH=69 /DNA_ID=CAMNT_0049510599 /DNA_START=14 /DNA_END=220 /DNA_ORIENTATION=-
MALHFVGQALSRVAAARTCSAEAASDRAGDSWLCPITRKITGRLRLCLPRVQLRRQPQTVDAARRCARA